VTAAPVSLSGAFPVEWCDTTRHSTDNAPLNGVVEVRGAATVDEVAAVVATLARGRRPPAQDAYEQWRRRRIVATRVLPVSTDRPSRVVSAFGEIDPL